MSTMKDIAKMAGVGLGTVSRVVNGTGPVSEETRKKVEDALNSTNYRPNRIARKLVSGKTGRGFYGVLMPLFIHPFYFYVLRGIHRFVEEQDMNLILFNRGSHPEEAISYLMQEDILGLMVMSHDLSKEEEDLLRGKSWTSVTSITTRSTARASGSITIPEAGRRRGTSSPKDAEASPSSATWETPSNRSNATTVSPIP
jgi:DNA-binding LacI/PurR family transcriptional regulator